MCSGCFRPPSFRPAVALPAGLASSCQRVGDPGRGAGSPGLLSRWLGPRAIGWPDKPVGGQGLKRQQASLRLEPDPRGTKGVGSSPAFLLTGPSPGAHGWGQLTLWLRQHHCLASDLPFPPWGVSLGPGLPGGTAYVLASQN